MATKKHSVYKALRRQGKSEESSARIAHSVVKKMGKKSKHRKKC